MSFIPPKELSDDNIRAMFKELFTVQERLAVSDLIQRGHYDDVGAALDVGDPKRAFYLDKYVSLKRPHAEPLDSVVQKEMREWEAKNGPIDTPEKAAFWQARLDAEKAGEELPPLEEVEGDVKMSKKDIIAELEAKGIEHDPAAKKADLKALLEANA